MSSPLHKALKKHSGKNLFDVKRHPRGVGGLTGFVMVWSEALVLFHQLDGSAFCLNGYSVICSDDVSGFRTFDRDQYWQRRFIRLRKLQPAAPVGVLVTDWRSLFESAVSCFPLVVIHTERKRPDVCYVGEVFKVSDSTVTIHDLDSNCEWQKPRRFKFSDITMVGVRRWLFQRTGCDCTKKESSLT